MAKKAAKKSAKTTAKKRIRVEYTKAKTGDDQMAVVGGLDSL